MFPGLRTSLLPLNSQGILVATISEIDGQVVAQLFPHDCGTTRTIFEPLSLPPGFLSGFRRGIRNGCHGLIITGQLNRLQTFIDRFTRPASANWDGADRRNDLSNKLIRGTFHNQAPTGIGAFLSQLTIVSSFLASALRCSMCSCRASLNSNRRLSISAGSVAATAFSHKILSCSSEGKGTIVS